MTSEQKVSLRQYWALFRRYLRPQRLWLLVLAVLISSGMGLRLATPQVLRRFVCSRGRAIRRSSHTVDRRLTRPAILYINCV